MTVVRLCLVRSVGIFAVLGLAALVAYLFLSEVDPLDLGLLLFLVLVVVAVGWGAADGTRVSRRRVRPDPMVWVWAGTAVVVGVTAALAVTALDVQGGAALSATLLLTNLLVGLFIVALVAGPSIAGLFVAIIATRRRGSGPRP